MMNQVRAYYYGWFTFFYGATIVVGLLVRLIITNTDQFGSELALVTMAAELMPAMTVAFVVYGVLHLKSPIPVVGQHR